MEKSTVDIITMGCSKNLVDSERLIRLFETAGFSATHNPSEVNGEYVVINTCGFIGDAKEESINMILDCCAAKAEGKVKKIFVMGCLSQRYPDELHKEIPEVDGWFGKFDWLGIVDEIAKVHNTIPDWDRSLTTPSHHAYLKVAEGCNRYCAFCAIPLITGRYKSRPIESIVNEVRHLVERGVKELNIIAQDLTFYGRDIYGKQSIAALVEDIAQVPGVEWIRLHYAYPADFPTDLLDVMAHYPNVCRYLDIALQHISDNVLSNMQRHIDGKTTRALLSEIRRRVPGIHIRTTLMVGFPGEGEAEFNELKEFVREQKFERMGAFAYCEEDDTHAAKNYSDEIPSDVKEKRLAELMEIQEEISMELNRSKIGQVMKVIVDSEDDDHYIGRTQFDSPEVDPEVLISKEVPLKIGEFYDVRITDAMPFELLATPLKSHNTISQ